MSVFRSKIFDKELGRQEKLGVVEKTDYSPWAAPTVYVKEKIKLESAQIIQLDCLKEINCPLTTVEEIFVNLNG